MDRRGFLGSVGVAATAALAGCLGGANPADSDGYPPEGEFGDAPPAKEFGDEHFRTKQIQGEAVTLASIEAVHNWYLRRETRVADARYQEQYDAAHVLGAALSPASGVSAEEDPVTDWPKDDRITCYCRCPHHLSGIRAANLQKAGYTDVYVIDEGFGEWYSRGYPMAGQQVAVRPEKWVVAGATDPVDAGAYAWATDPASGQREAAPIQDDGAFSLNVHFYDVDGETPIRVRTPSFEVEAPLAELAAGRVTATGV